MIDRTSELRKKGFEGRRLGPIQMTTDTAVRVTRMVIQDKIPLDQIQYVDHPKLKINRHETTQMPFRYVKGDDNKPVMPEVCSQYNRDHNKRTNTSAGNVGTYSKRIRCNHNRLIIAVIDHFSGIKY